MEEENKLTDMQIFITVIYIASLVLATYNLVIRKKGSKANKENYNLRAFNKYLLIIIYLAFLYVAYISYKKTYSKADKIGYIGAFIAVIPPILFLYGFYIQNQEKNSINPNI